MTISDTNQVRTQAAGNGVATNFPYIPPVHGDSELIVYLTDTLTDTTVIQVLNVDYTISGLPVGGPYPNGVTVIFVAAPLATDIVTLLRNTILSQEESFVVNGPFPSVVMEQALDKLTEVIQEHQESIDRALLFAPSQVASISGVLPLAVADQLLGWNAAADALENKAPVDTALLDAAVLAAQTAAANAATSETNAATSETNAATSETNAAASAAAAAASAASIIPPDIDTVQTLDATVTTLKTIPTVSDTIGSIRADVLGRASTGAGNYYRRFAKYQNIAGVVTLDTQEAVTLESVLAWDFTLSVSGTNILARVTGAAATTIDWEALTTVREL